MKILLCHLTLSLGPLEKNLKILERALQIAGEVKADWVITPETAVQGYHFYKIDPEQKLDPQPAEYLTPLRNLARKNRQYLFLGAGEYDVNDKCNYNTCFVFGPDGELVGKHRKNHSHGYGGEGWVTNSTIAEPVQVGNVKTGIMVCSDTRHKSIPTASAPDFSASATIASKVSGKTQSSASRNPIYLPFAAASPKFLAPPCLRFSGEAIAFTLFGYLFS